MRRRPGFTLIEILAALFIFIALSVIILVNVVPQVRRAGATAVISSLSATADGLSRFKADIGLFPSQLVWLTTTPPGTATDLCGNVIPAFRLSRWGGPYHTTPILATGIPAGDASIQNAVVRVPAAGLMGFIVITAVGVDLETANRVNEAFDDDGNLSGGTIWWVSGGASGVDTLRYVMPARGC